MKTKIITIIIMISALLCVNLSKNYAQKQVPEINKYFPREMNGWTGVDFKPDEGVYSMLRKNELLLRNYKNNSTGEKVSLAIVLSNKRDQIHDPNLCYRGQGLMIEKEVDKNISPEDIVKFTECKKYGKNCNMIFWYTDFKKVYSDRASFMSNVIFSKLFDKPMDGLALVVIIGHAKKNPSENPELVKFAHQVNDELFKLVKTSLH